MKSILFLSLILLSLAMSAQEKEVFSETFADNHNNWPVIDKKGLKTSVSAEKYYDINNQSKDNYTSLVAVPLDSTKDFHIKIEKKSLRWDDKNSARLNGFSKFIIGAKDENSGYTIGIAENTLLISAKGQHAISALDYQEIEIQHGDPDYLDVRIENNRWKFYSRNGIEIANISARPVDGNKIGVMVYQPARYALTNIVVTEREKQIIKTDFNLALFMFAYRQLLCSANHLFKNDFGTPYKDSKNIWYSKTSVQGFGFYTYLIKDEKSIELNSSRRVNTLDEAYAYYEAAISGIKLTKDSCLEMTNNTTLLRKDDYFKTHYVQFENWRTGFRDDHAEKVEGNVLVAISKEYNQSTYLVEFHILLNLSGKVF